jgi:hypothetical protein
VCSFIGTVGIEPFNCSYGKGATCRPGVTSRPNDFQKLFTARRDIPRVAIIFCKGLDGIYIFSSAGILKLLLDFGHRNDDWSGSGSEKLDGREVAPLPYRS